MNPWQTEQLVPDRVKELRRMARRRRHSSVAAAASPAGPSVRWTRPALARQVGVVLIAVGRRLADPEAFPGAFEGSHRS